MTRISLSALDRRLERVCWTDAELARESGVDRGTIGNLRRSGEVRRDTLDKIVRALVAKEAADAELVRVVDELLVSDGDA